MFRIWSIVRGVSILLGLLLLVVSILWVEATRTSKVCSLVDIVINGNEAQHFVSKATLHEKITEQCGAPVVGQPLHALKTHFIENTIKSNSFVRRGIVYKNLRGHLKVIVTLKQPIARVLLENASGKYIDEQGELLPLSDYCTARVPIVTVETLPRIAGNLCESAHGANVLKLLRYINGDPFWQAQIAYIHIDTQGKILMHTQVSKQCVEFGYPEDIERKFDKLLLFYQKIVPHKGWNTYKRVNLEFARQIICE
ncbi:MAG: hypothetical protein AAFP93_00270 [Bacteroidota bacterium]